MQGLSVSCELWSSSHVPVLSSPPSLLPQQQQGSPPLSLGVGGVLGLLASSGWGLPWTLFYEMDSALGGDLLFPPLPVLLLSLLMIKIISGVTPGPFDCFILELVYIMKPC